MVMQDYIRKSISFISFPLMASTVSNNIDSSVLFLKKHHNIEEVS